MCMYMCMYIYAKNLNGNFTWGEGGGGGAVNNHGILGSIQKVRSFYASLYGEKRTKIKKLKC